MGQAKRKYIKDMSEQQVLIGLKYLNKTLTGDNKAMFDRLVREHHAAYMSKKQSVVGGAK